MIDICVSELCCLDMKINSKKSSCIWFGKFYNHESVHLCVDGVLLPWSSYLKYLGVTLKSSIKFAVDSKHSRSGFYKSFNAIYSKVSRAKENVILSLVKTFCMPTLLYGIEALNLNVSTLSNLDSPLRQAFYKVFKTYDKVTIDYCMYYTYFLPPRYEFLYRKIKFLIKNRSSVNNLVFFWCKFRVVHELELLCRQLNVNSEDYFHVIRDRIFELYERSFNAS